MEERMSNRSVVAQQLRDEAIRREKSRKNFETEMEQIAVECTNVTAFTPKELKCATCQQRFAYDHEIIDLALSTCKHYDDKAEPCKLKKNYEFLRRMEAQGKIKPPTVRNKIAALLRPRSEGIDGLGVRGLPADVETMIDDIQRAGGTVVEHIGPMHPLTHEVDVKMLPVKYNDPNVPSTNDSKPKVAILSFDDPLVYFISKKGKLEKRE